MEINGAELKDLLKEVVVPISAKLEEKSILDTDFKKLKSKHLFAYLALMLLTKPEYAEDRFIKAINEEGTLGDLEFNEFKEILDEFFKLLNDFGSKLLSKKLDYYHKFFLETYKHKTNKSVDEEFFDLDSYEEFSGFDANYVEKSMHFKDRDKVSAEEFLRNADFDEDLILDIDDLLNEYFSLAFKVSIEEKEFFIDIFRKFAFLFKICCFNNLSEALYSLVSFLEKLDLDKLNNDEKKLLYNFIDAIMEDLNKWFREVILEKSAKDVHYLDASLMSSIEQIKSFFKFNTKE